MSEKITNKTVVITGASSGLGRELKELFEKSGNTVLGLSRSDCGGGWRECDVTDYDSVRKCIDSIGMEFGRIDILINNAGVGISGAVELTSDADYRKVMSTDVDGVFNVCRAAVKYMGRGSKIESV